MIGQTTPQKAVTCCSFHRLSTGFEPASPPMGCTGFEPAVTWFQATDVVQATPTPQWAYPELNWNQYFVRVLCLPLHHKPKCSQGDLHSCPVMESHRCLLLHHRSMCQGEHLSSRTINHTGHLWLSYQLHLTYSS